MDGWIQDGKYALRSILSAKRFAAIVIATLALGIGANTAVFSVLHAVVLQPLPYEEPSGWSASFKPAARTTAIYRAWRSSRCANTPRRSTSRRSTPTRSKART